MLTDIGQPCERLVTERPQSDTPEMENACAQAGKTRGKSVCD